MARFSVGFVLLLGLSAIPCQAEDQNAAPVDRGDSRVVVEPKYERVQSIEDLIQVAEQLEQTGRRDAATNVRAEARALALKDDLLARKEAELERLHKEVNSIRKLTGNESAILVRVTALEVNRSKLGEKADQFDKLLGRLTPDKEAGSRIDLKNPLFDELRRRQVIAVLAEPTLITTNARPASYLSGGQFAIPTGNKQLDGNPAVRWETFGVHLDVVPVVLAGGRIRLQAAFKVSEKDNRNTSSVHGFEVPSLTTRSLKTEIEVQHGETVALGMMRSARYLSDRPADGTEQTEKKRGVNSTGGNGAGSVSGTIELLPDEPPNDGEEAELIVLLTVELANHPSPPPPGPLNK